MYIATIGGITAFQNLTYLATGGPDMNCFGCWSMPSTPQVFDDRHNPKMWQKWFYEFLIEKIPAKIEQLIFPLALHQVVDARARAAPRNDPRQKMKLWKQSLAE